MFYFDGCLLIEIMVVCGCEILCYGLMKLMGLINVYVLDIKVYVVVQLCQDNVFGMFYNMVGFQIKLKYGSQVDIFCMILGLENV